ncbi:hypothetical protein HHX47_DHR7000337 [Lentinula edodes]|nr:hypothetical protein HHX47_DHR7000337 [Lentinula edodes]
MLKRLDGLSKDELAMSQRSNHSFYDDAHVGNASVVLLNLEVMGKERNEKEGVDSRVTGKDSQSNPAKFILWVSRISTAPAICPNLSFPDDVLRGAEASKARIFESLKFGGIVLVATFLALARLLPIDVHLPKNA